MNPDTFGFIWENHRPTGCNRNLHVLWRGCRYIGLANEPEAYRRENIFRHVNFPIDIEAPPDAAIVVVLSNRRVEMLLIRAQKLGSSPWFKLHNTSILLLRINNDPEVILSVCNSICWRPGVNCKLFELNNTFRKTRRILS